MKKSLRLIVVCTILIICLLAGKTIFDKLDYKNPNEENITEAEAAKAIALMYYNQTQCDEEKDDSRFQGNEGKWYESYVNIILKNTPEFDFFKADYNRMESKLTYNELDEMLKQLNMDDNIDSSVLEGYMNKHDGKEKISRQDWFQIYDEILQLTGKSDNVQKCELTIAGSGDKVVTDLGNYIYNGNGINNYVDTRCEVFVRDNIIIAFGDVTDSVVEYKNVWIEESEKDKVKVFFNGQERLLKVKGYEENIENAVADVRIENHTITSLAIKSDRISGKVLEISDDTVEVEGFGKLQLDNNFRVYNVIDGVKDSDISSVLVGYSNQTFIVADGKISCAIIDNMTEADNIRVLITTNGFKSKYHDAVTLTCNTNYKLNYGEITEEHVAGERISVDETSDYLRSGRFSVIPENDGKIELLSIERGYGNPSYRGKIEVSSAENGILIVNELSLEQYLYSVVPSEMPVSYGVEALKVQAVCARSYAYRHLLSNSCSEFGAHVDDSTRFQVYNNTEETEESIKAVDDTYGQVMKYDNEIVLAYFYSTSCGCTTTSEIWGGEPLPYIKSRPLNSSGEIDDLSNEVNFDNFIRSKFDSFDSAFGWYRWNIKFTFGDLADSINSNIEEIYDDSPESVLTLDEDGEYKSIPIDYVGTIEGLATGNRLDGGVLNELIIYGSEATVKIKKELNIRKILCPYGININKNDGTMNDSMSMLPSAYFVLDAVDDGYVVTGGGFGHGAGMSQSAVKVMVDSMSYTDILKFFYNGVNIEGIYS